MSLSAKSNGTQKEIRLMPDITTPPFASEDGSSFSDNFCLIDLQNHESLCNQPSYFSYTSQQLKSGSVLDIPNGVDINQSFSGYREVFPLRVSADNNSHIVVKVTEFFPVMGREHYKAYNTNGWVDWKSVNNT